MTSEPYQARSRRQVPQRTGTTTGKNPLGTVLAVIVVLALVAIPVVAVLGGERSTPAGDSSAAGTGGGGRTVLDVPEADAPESTEWTPDTSVSEDEMDVFVENSTGSQVTFVRLSDGFHAGTATERFTRPALSLSKLYIADHVLTHGTEEEIYQAIEMIRSSDNSTADELYERYPESIEATAEEYGLLSTRSAEHWGYSTTSTYDVVTFIAALMEKSMTHPILVAMAASEDVAADGYEQDFGTAVLPGALGTKWGWSDDRQLHSSVTFGEDWVAAAAVTGSADDLTSLVEHQIEDLPGMGD